MKRRMCLLALTISVAGCSALDLGPPPDNDVGPGPGASTRTMTSDEAVAPATGPDAVAAIQASTSQPAGTQPSASPPAATQASGTQPAPGAPATQAAVATQPGDLTLSVQDAIFTALQNNPSLRVQRINPLISRTSELAAVGAFDPVINGQITAGRTGSRGTFNTSSNTSVPGVYNNTVNAQGSVQEFLPTGTTIGGNITSSYTSQSAYSDSSTRLGMTVSQALLRGAGLDVNLASLREAQIDTKVSQYELRGFAESLVAQVEQTYWDYVLALRNIEIFQESLDLAQQQLDQTNILIRVSRVAENERAAAQAEVALRKEDLINARSTVETTRLTLLQLMSPGRKDFWNKKIAIRDKPFVPTGLLDDVEEHVKVALQYRPDLNQARLEIKRGDLAIVQTKNGLLPQLDLFVTLGKTGYSKSFGGTFSQLNGPDYDALIGLSVNYPITNATARAAYRASVLSKEQAEESLDNLTQLAQVDVRSAYIEVNRLKEQITATGATLTAQAAALYAETQKFRNGRSTALLVSQAQRDYTQAQIDQVSAVTGYLKALINLYQMEGSLLERRGIHAPGRAPATYATQDGGVAITTTRPGDVTGSSNP